jgi:hypothetical protein
MTGRELVWIENWEMRCCGEPFSVGDSVDWSALPLSDRSWYAEFGLEKAPTWIYSAHSDNESKLRGTVEEIEAVFFRFRVVNRKATRIAGTGILEHRTHATTFEPHDHWGGPKSWCGYLVRLNTDSRAS